MLVRERVLKATKDLVGTAQRLAGAAAQIRPVLLFFLVGGRCGTGCCCGGSLLAPPLRSRLLGCRAWVRHQC